MKLEITNKQRGYIAASLRNKLQALQTSIYWYDRREDRQGLREDERDQRQKEAIQMVEIEELLNKVQ